MKKTILTLTTFVGFAFASPAVTGGITYNFGGDTKDSPLSGAGATVKVISTSEEKKPVVGAGVSYYPWTKSDNKFGLDVSAGYNFKKGSAMAGWDFLQNQPTVSLGYNKEIKSDKDSKYVDGIQDARCDKSKELDE